MALEPNTLVSHYKILSSIGKGGMGEVYLAEDTKLDRKVAIKFLSKEFDKDEDKVNRFILEAKATSALNHPNILTVHGIDAYGDTHFIATEFIEGETLRDLISARGSISLNRALKIAIQVSEALSAAHGAGIAHRDIKPENIMVRKDGYVKVLDFGLAKLAEQRKAEDDISLEGETKALVKTSPGVVMGTVSYMSPEQARGQETDGRTDIWSLGVVLYEMLSGKVPFEGETTNHTIVSILENEPRILENIPDELQRIVRKTLTKDIAMRYQNTGDLVIDLKNLRRDLDVQGELERSIVPDRIQDTDARKGLADVTADQPSPVSTRDLSSTSSLEYAVTKAKSHKAAAGMVGLALIAAVSAAVYFGIFYGSSGQIESVAVMPFLNESGNEEIEYLSDGMTETLISSLSQIPNLNVKSRSAVFRYKGKQTASQTIGQELGVQTVLNGRIVQRGEQLILSLELIDAATDNVIWSDKYEKNKSDIVSLQTEIARDVSSKLKTRLSGAEEAMLARNYSKNPKAYELYLKGRFYWNRRKIESINQSLEYFKKAVEADPEYALAYTGISDAHALTVVYQGATAREAMPKAREAAQKALALDDQLAEAHTALALVLGTYDYDFKAAEREYKRAIELDPDYATAHQWYAELLYYLGRFEEARKEIKLALEIEPESFILNRVYGIILLHSRRYDEAEAQAKRTVDLDRDLSGPLEDLFEIYSVKKDYPGAVDAKARYEQGLGKQELADKLRASFSGGGWQGFLETLIEFELESGPPYAAAKRAAMLGRNDKAFELLERSLEERTFHILQIRVDALMDPIRSDPRYPVLLKKIGFPD